MSDDLLARITIEDDKRGGKPCVRGLRITVGEVLGMLASGESTESILHYHPDLEADDIRACLAYGAREVDHPVIIAA